MPARTTRCQHRTLTPCGADTANHHAHVELLLCQEDGKRAELHSELPEPACLCMQILLEGSQCYPAEGASSLSLEYVWQQLVPGFAALVRSLCTAVEAWPPELAKPQGTETEPGDAHVPLGLQYTVRPSPSVAPCVSVACLCFSPYSHAVLPAEAVVPAWRHCV